MSHKIKTKKEVSYKYVYMEHTTDGHNKFYEMTENPTDNKFKARWGRIGTAGTPKEYPMRDWYRIKSQKEAKGYNIVKEEIRRKEEKREIEITDKIKKILLKINELIDLSNKALNLKQGQKSYTLEKHREILGIKEKANNANVSKEDMQFLNERYKMLKQILG